MQIKQKFNQRKSVTEPTNFWVLSEPMGKEKKTSSNLHKIITFIHYPK